MRRAGDVIPEVVGPVLTKRPQGDAQVEVPDEVPGLCGSRSYASRVRRTTTASTSTARPSGCSASCTGPAAARWTSKGLGEERVRQFVDAGLLEDAADVYGLTVERLVPLERIGQRSAQLLVDAIEGSKTRPLWRVLVGLGINHVGPTAAQALAAELRRSRRDRSRRRRRRSPRSTASARRSRRASASGSRSTATGVSSRG